MSEQQRGFLSNPFALARPRHWKNVLEASGGVDRPYRAEAWRVGLVNRILSPLHSFESLLYDRRIAETRIEHDPLFIIGHWRTGTTHLHNLLTHDPKLGYVTTLQTLLPEASIIGDKLLRGIIRLYMPKKRPHDNMPMGPHMPQEEEIAMSQITTQSYYLGLYFPRMLPELLDKYVLFSDSSREEIETWKATYLRLIRKATYIAKGRRLVLKSPTNTGRIRYLLELFPDAKFIHMHRNPYEVFYSTRKFFRAVFDLAGLQDISDDDFDEIVFNTYRKLLQAYLEQKDLIPEGNLVEASYLELTRQPEETLTRIYETLDLPGHDAAWREMSGYLPKQRDFKPSEHILVESDRERIDTEWGEAFDLWSYARASQLTEAK